MNKEYFNKYFYYDETSPTCLRWKVSNGQTNYSQKKSGDVAGFISIPDVDKNYQRYKVGVGNKEYLVHRIIMILHGFSLDGLTVNHINCNPMDNRIKNLEVCTTRENSLRKSVILKML